MGVGQNDGLCTAPPRPLSAILPTLGEATGCQADYFAPRISRLPRPYQCKLSELELLLSH